MPSEKTLLRTLDMLTVAPQAEIGGLEMGATARVDTVKNIIDGENIVAVGISEKISDEVQTGTLAVTFYVDRKKPLKELSGDEVIPPALLLDVTAPPCPTDVVAIGQPQLEAPRVRRKPVQPGFSIGHPDITAGTLGAIVKNSDGKLCLLSNSHVLANSGTGKKGDKILYPGKLDGGSLLNDADVIAELMDFVAFQLGGAMVNRVDCAIAVPLPAHLAQLVSEIEEIGLPKGILKPKRGMTVVKSGRTTAKTEGEIRDVNFRMAINYPNGLGKVGFLDQVYCTRYTEGGDSGSLVIEKVSGKAVGLHFAGYPDSHGALGSVFNPIQDVLSALKVKLVTKSLTPAVT